MPFFIRTGKLLPVTQTEVRLVFRRPPRLGFGGADFTPEANMLVVKLDPSTGIRIQVDAHRADQARVDPITLDMEFAQEGGEGPTPYEVLLSAAMAGDTARFTRAGRGGGDLADHAAAAGRADPGAPLRTLGAGGPRRLTP